MKKLLLILILPLLIAINGAFAKTAFMVSLEGAVINTLTNKPIGGCLVELKAYNFSGYSFYESKLLSDRLGHFSFKFQSQGGGVIKLRISDPAFPTKDTLIIFSPTFHEVKTTIQVNGIHNVCQALYRYHQIENSSLVQFENSSLGNISSCLWEFGDGTTSTESSPQHAFKPGSYIVSLSVFGEGNLSDKTTDTIKVAEVSCESQFTWTPTGPMEIHFDATTSTMNPVTFYWLFGDGTEGYGQQIDHSYSSAGQYTITLVTTDDYGCLSEHQGIIFVDEIPSCIAHFTSTPDPGSSLMIHFASESGGNNLLYKWDFGDMSYSTVQNPTHIYNNAGEYLVTLFITDSVTQCYDSVSELIGVGPGYFFNISGQVLEGFFPTDSVLVEAFIENSNQTIIRKNSMVSGPYGIYNFYALPKGNYIIKATPLSSSSSFNNYVTTYYGNTVNWNESTRISLTQDLNGMDISLRENPNINGGFGQIKGEIWIQTDEFLLKGKPASDIQVLLFDQSDHLVNGCFSDDNGTFIFYEIPMGNYKLRPEVTGVTATNFDIEITPENPNLEELIVVIHDNTVAYGIEDGNLPTLKDIGGIWPVPATNEVNIEILSKQAEEYTVTIFSANGLAVSKISFNNGDSQNVLRIPLDHFASGLYLIKIEADGFLPVSRKCIVK